MSDLRIEEIIFKDFPRDKMPWAIDKSGRVGNSAVNDQTRVLILWLNDKRVVYLCYQIWNKWNPIDIHYVQTHINFQNKGYASILMKEICKRYHKEFDIIADSTSKASEKLLQKCGFKQVTPGAITWLLPKIKEQIEP